MYSKVHEGSMRGSGILWGLVLSLVCALSLNTARAASSYLYVLDSNNAAGGGNTIYGFAVNESTGALTLLAGFPINTGGIGNPNVIQPRLHIDRLNQRLYAENGVSQTLAAYSIDPATGALTALPYNGFPLGTGNWCGVQVHPSGSPLVLGDQNSTAIASYNVTATTITAAAGSPYNMGSVSTFTDTFSPDGLYLYSGGAGTTPIAGFSVDPTTGILTGLAGSPFTLPGAGTPKSYCVDTQGRLFAANTANLLAFTTAAGIPTPVTGNPFATNLSNDQYAILTPDEAYYIIANPGGNQVGVFQISGAGASTALFITQNPFPTNGTGPNALAITTNGNFLFADNRDSRNITTYSFTKATGALTQTNLQAPNTTGVAGRNLGMDYLPIVDLGLTMTSNPPIVTAGSAAINLVFTVTLTNAGPSTAKDVKILTTLALPAGVSLVNGLGPVGTTYDPNTRIWTVNSLDVGSVAALTLSVSVGSLAKVGPNVISASSTVQSVRAGRLNVARGTASTQASVGTAISSGPTVNPPTPLVGQPATFSMGLAGTGVAVTWDFGDGTTGTGNPVNHAYANSGTYLVTVTINDGLQSYTRQVLVTVDLYSTVIPIIGIGVDTDGDGFSDAFELANGSNPNDASSTPFSGAKVQAPATLDITNASIKLNFKKTGADTISFKGNIGVPAGFLPEGKTVFAVVGNVMKIFKLERSGLGKDDTSKFKIAAKGRKALNQPQIVPYMMTTKGDFAARLADYGFLNDNVGPAGITVPISLYINGGLSQELQPLSYLAIKGEKGTAKK